MANSHVEHGQSKTMGGLAEKISGRMKAKTILEVTQCSRDAKVQIQLIRKDFGEYSRHSVETPEDRILE